MKNHMTATKALLLTLLVVGTLVSIVAIRGTSARRSGSQQGADNDFVVVRDALRRGGLREAAKVKGHYVAEYDPHYDFGLFDIEALTKGSSAVVVGTVAMTIGARVEDGGQVIYTDYAVVVSETFKGVPTKGVTITISLPGGKVEFEDGTSAEQRARDFEHVKPGKVYAFFLSESKHGPDEYVLTGGPQGLVELMADGSLKSHGRPTDPVALETKDPKKARDKNLFLKEIHKQAVKWPAPGKCCS